MNFEEICLLTVTLVKAWGRLKNISEAIIPGGKEAITAFGVVHLQFGGQKNCCPSFSMLAMLHIKLEVFLL